MRTYLECYPCFMKQALDTTRHLGLPEDEARQILVAVGESLRDIRLDMSPPEIAGRIHGVIRQHTAEADPYHAEKVRFTELARRVYPELSSLAREAEDPLLTATVIAIIGNIIDFGVLTEAEVRTRLDTLLDEELDAAERESGAIFAFPALLDALSRASSVLYIGDNAGETVFDKVLIETICATRPGTEVTYAVRGQPIINDAVLEDARNAGLDEVATLVSSGSALPGTVLADSPAEFQGLFRDADVVVSKGQGNYESLSDTDHEIFFLLMAKCPVIAKDIGCSVGDIVLLHHQGRRVADPSDDRLAGQR
jgi:damage-control phosphatase, subfamily I